MIDATVKKYVSIFAGACMVLVLLGYIPSFTVDRGFLFGIIKIDVWDDIVHIAAALLAASAAFYSSKAAALYFKIAGSIFLLDALFGIFFEYGLLDMSYFLYETRGLGMDLRLAANTPHLLLGLLALAIGWFFIKKDTGIAAT